MVRILNDGEIDAIVIKLNSLRDKRTVKLVADAFPMPEEGVGREKVEIVDVLPYSASMRCVTSSGFSFPIHIHSNKIFNIRIE